MTKVGTITSYFPTQRLPKHRWLPSEGLQESLDEFQNEQHLGGKGLNQTHLCMLPQREHTQYGMVLLHIHCLKGNIHSMLWSYCTSITSKGTYTVCYGLTAHPLPQREHTQYAMVLLYIHYLKGNIHSMLWSYCTSITSKGTYTVCCGLTAHPLPQRTVCYGLLPY